MPREIQKEKFRVTYRKSILCKDGVSILVPYPKLQVREIQAHSPDDAMRRIEQEDQGGTYKKRYMFLAVKKVGL